MSDTDVTFKAIKDSIHEVIDFVLFGIWVATAIAVIMVKIKAKDFK